MKRFLLFHGSFLLNMDLAAIERYLSIPDKQPDYRKSRPHRDFLTNIQLKAETVKSALASGWKAVKHPAALPINERTRQLVLEKYSQDSWNLKF